MIQNPKHLYFQYDPYQRTFTEEKYDQALMVKNRTGQIEKCKNGKIVGVILGILGRQGSTHILQVRE